MNAINHISNSVPQAKTKGSVHIIDINNIIKCALIHGCIENFYDTAEKFGMPHYHRFTGVLGVRGGSDEHIDNFVHGAYWIIDVDYPVFDRITREFLHEYRH